MIQVQHFHIYRVSLATEATFPMLVSVLFG